MHKEGLMQNPTSHMWAYAISACHGKKEISATQVKQHTFMRMHLELLASIDCVVNHTVSFLTHLSPVRYWSLASVASR